MRKPHLHATSLATLLGGAVAMFLAPAALALETTSINAVLSATETAAEDETSTTLTWSLDGEWKAPSGGQQLVLKLNSDYAKGDRAELDRLRTSLRWLDADYGKAPGKWYPVYLVQTEGDHGFESAHTLAAAGFRRQLKHGFLEVTGGASKDVRTAQAWVGDVGFEFGYEQKLGDHWTVRTGPKGEFGVLGQARVRDDRLRYSWDVNLTYQATESLGVGYRLWLGNTVPESDRTQWIGITYRYRK